MTDLDSPYCLAPEQIARFRRDGFIELDDSRRNCLESTVYVRITTSRCTRSPAAALRPGALPGETIDAPYNPVIRRASDA